MLGVAMVASGCERRTPPAGAEPSTFEFQLTGEGSYPNAEPEATSETTGPTVRAGGPSDNLPFSTPDLSIGSIAWRTWVYTDTGPARTRLGYLRAGEVVPARGPQIRNAGCDGGWYRINPRGFVCIGKGATTDLSHPVLREVSRRPVRGAGFPYHYALSQKRPPHRYFRLPSKAQMREVEGPRVEDRAAAFRLRAEESGLAAELRLSEPPPDFLQDAASIVKPYGVERHQRRQVSAGQASAESGFALLSNFYWEGRAFALTTELDLIPLDRTDVVREPEFQGVELGEGDALPVAFHVRGLLTLFEQTASGEFRAAGGVRKQRAFKLTGREQDGMLESVDGLWMARSAVRVLEPRTSFPSVATGIRRWIDISVNGQTLVAYIGRRPTYATLVSTGRGGLGPKGDDNPDGSRTIRGTFMIHEKALSSTMDGDDDRADSFDLKDVPHVQYFHRGFALHGAYWHDDFGRQRSHGCINLAAKDAAWLFEWTDPPLPLGWHAVQNKQRGTVVHVGY